MTISDAKSKLSSERRTRKIEKCAFCEVPTPYVIANLSQGGKRRKKTPLCCLHYYTSRALRCKDVQTLIGSESIQSELNKSGVQDLFAEAYLELQQELIRESALAFQQRKADPLAIVNNLRGKPKEPPKPAARKKFDPNGGGFLPTLLIPEKIKQSNQDGNGQQKQKTASKSTASTTRIHNPYEKRKSSRQSIWKLAMDKSSEEVTGDFTIHPMIACKCGSQNVTSNGNISSGYSNVAKAETWGFKDRSEEVIERYVCGSCGKTWNNEV